MADREPSSAAVGWISFAGFMLILGGSFAIFAGLGGVLNPDSLGAKDLVFGQSADTWGWWHILWGLVILLSGFGVFSGNVLARTVGVIAATVSAISAFVSMPIYPLWGLTVVIIDVAIIWALTAHGRDIQKMQG